RRRGRCVRDRTRGVLGPKRSAVCTTDPCDCRTLPPRGRRGNGPMERAAVLHHDHLVLGRYRPLRPLGSGGSGSVWLVRDERSARDVALKVVPREGKAGSRAEREVEAATRLRHPRCLRALALERDDRHVYVAYEYVPGRTLRQALRYGELDDTTAVEAAARPFTPRPAAPADQRRRPHAGPRSGAAPRREGSRAAPPGRVERARGAAAGGHVADDARRARRAGCPGGGLRRLDRLALALFPLGLAPARRGTGRSDRPREHARGARARSRRPSLTARKCFAWSRARLFRARRRLVSPLCPGVARGASLPTRARAGSRPGLAAPGR